jgi:outer membrane protein TolC
VTLQDALRGALERDLAFAVERLDGERRLLEAEQAGRSSMTRLSLTSTGTRYQVSDYYQRREATATLGLQKSTHPGRSVSVSLRETSWLLDDYDDERTMWSHDPSLGVTIRQSLAPGAVSGRALAEAARARPAALRSGAQADLDDARTRAVLETARLYFQVAEWRRLVRIRETALGERRAQAKAQEASASLRLGGQRDLQRELLSIREEELALASDRSALARREADLRAALGLDSFELDSDIPSVPRRGDEQALRSRALEASAALRRAAAELRLRQADRATAGIADAPALNIGVSIDGEYDTTDTVERTYEDSLSTLGPRLILSVLVDLPLLRSRDRDLARQAAAAGEAKAAAERARRQADVMAEVADLSAERERALAMIDVRERQAAVAAEDLRVATGLLAAQQAAPSEVSRLRVEVQERELALWRARVDLFLLDLELAALVGDDLGRLLLTTSPRDSAAAPS